MKAITIDFSTMSHETKQSNDMVFLWFKGRILENPVVEFSLLQKIERDWLVAKVIKET